MDLSSETVSIRKV